ncbi:hypothetical protein [Actinokineospora sp. HUAS TT18]|uniref:hypothetical protein n=1 Tax=Actinokineospora sp. HUAS TT18 TaxID=3447451 RepID=UPI003F51F8F7
MTEDWKPYLPPRRTMPAGVRERILARTFGDAPAPDRRLRTRLAVAAAIAAVIAGGWATSLTSGDSQSPGARGPEIAPNAGTDLDRCWAALVGTGRSDRYPARALWRAVVTAREAGKSVIGFRAGATPVFCETTVTSVTVSDPTAKPNHADGTGTAALLLTDSGGAGGIADEKWTSVTVEWDGKVRQADVRDGMWVLPTLPTDPTVVWRVSPSGPGVPGRQVLDLPRPEGAPVSVFDRPLAPGERTSLAGAWLGNCLSRTQPQPADMESWRPGATTTVGGHRVVTARLGDLVGVCVTEPNRSTFEVAPGHAVRPGRLRYAKVVKAAPGQGARIVGFVQPEVAAMAVTAGESAQVSVPITDSGFAVEIPETLAPTADTTPEHVQVTLTSEDGTVLYAGEMFPK